MAPPLFNWGVKDTHRGTPVVVKMENPNWLIVELEGPEEDGLMTPRVFHETKEKEEAKM